MTTEELFNKQETYCDNHGFPMFIPAFGICYRCGCNLATLIDEQYASNHLITSCPKCHVSFCD